MSEQSLNKKLHFAITGESFCDHVEAQQYGPRVCAKCGMWWSDWESIPDYCPAILREVRGELRLQLGNLVVHEILEWNDIENEFGQTMVSFWAGESFSVMWV